MSEEDNLMGGWLTGKGRAVEAESSVSNERYVATVMVAVAGVLEAVNSGKRLDGGEVKRRIVAGEKFVMIAGETDVTRVAGLMVVAESGDSGSRFEAPVLVESVRVGADSQGRGEGERTTVFRWRTRGGDWIGGLVEQVEDGVRVQAIGVAKGLEEWMKLVQDKSKNPDMWKVGESLAAEVAYEMGKQGLALVRIEPDERRFEIPRVQIRWQEGGESIYSTVRYGLMVNDGLLGELANASYYFDEVTLGSLGKDLGGREENG